MLIYTDLANRSRSKKLTLHNFSLFFELTGLWGNKLFRHFLPNGEEEMGSAEFTNGMSNRWVIQFRLCVRRSTRR
jgi:hypothetical protein